MSNQYFDLLIYERRPMSSPFKNSKDTPQPTPQTPQIPNMDTSYCIRCNCAPKKVMPPRNSYLSQSFVQLPKWHCIEDTDDTDEDDTEDTLIISDEDFSEDFSDTISYDSEDEYVPTQKKKKL